MSVNKGFTFRAPKVPGTNSIDHLSFDEFYEMSLAGMPLPAFPPRTLKQLVALVDQGKTAEISVLEWLDVVENEHHWSGLTEKQQYDACRAIWLAICTNDTLGNIAFFKAGLAVEGLPTTMVKPLLNTMDVVRHVPGLNALDADRIDWLNAVKGKDWSYLANSCYEHDSTPKRRVKKLMLPNANQYVKQLPVALVECAPRSVTEATEDWLERCFNSFNAIKDKAQFCDALIQQYCDNLYRGELKTLLSENCLPNVDESLWYEVSDSSRERLKSAFSLSSYFELDAIAKRLCSDSCANELDIDDQQRKQIRSRTQFWSNYSEKFSRIRVLLPSNTYRLLERHGLTLSQQVNTFKSATEQCAEVIIFELDRLLVVEVLRGDLSETRFFKNTEWNAKRLLDGDFECLADIRDLPQTEVHDHMILWQYFCEKMLRTKFRVTPNDGVVYFAGIPKSVSYYSDKKGLQKPNQTMLAERAIQLEQWVELFWRYEFKTSKYGEQSGLQQRSNVYLFKAQVAKQTGNDENHELYIKKAANQGNPEAMWQLGSKLLLSANRQHGEQLIAKAAEDGHIKAREAAERFGIKISVVSEKMLYAVDEFVSGLVEVPAMMRCNSFDSWTDLQIYNKAFGYLQHRKGKVNLANVVVLYAELDKRTSETALKFSKDLFVEVHQYFKQLEVEY
ncbi:EH signature domain-containing protein [Photobacterium satsumensis]|uniref:EH signature domain-containing protein n=1 Tax=Photobacterium satsumensis TaxID=2910239 RepID=UPI003D120885